MSDWTWRMAEQVDKWCERESELPKKCYTFPKERVISRIWMPSKIEYVKQCNSMHLQWRVLVRLTSLHTSASDFLRFGFNTKSPFLQRKVVSKSATLGGRPSKKRDLTGSPSIKQIQMLPALFLRCQWNRSRRDESIQTSSTYRSYRWFRTDQMLSLGWSNPLLHKVCSFLSCVS